MPYVAASTDVREDIGTVYDQWTWFESFPDFMGTVKRVTRVDDSHVRLVAEVAGRTNEWEAEIVEQVPNTRIVWSSVSGAPNGGVVTFAPLGSGATRVTLRLDYEPESRPDGGGDPVGVMQRQVHRELENFKHFVEDRGTRTGVARPHRELTGSRQPADERSGMAFIDKTIEVDADVRDVYAQWVAYEDYPDFMTEIESVTFAADDRLLWVAEIEGVTHEWDTDLVEHVDEQKIEWRAADGREAGEVRFEKLGTGRTSITYQLEYDPDAWDGDPVAVSRWMRRRVTEGLAAFKEIVEGRAAA